MAGSTGGAIRAGAAFVQLFADDSQLSRGLSRAQARLNSFGRAAMGIGAGLIGAGAGILAAFSQTIQPLRDLGKLDDVRNALGLTAAEASGLFGVFKASGSDIRDATEGLLTLSGRVSDAISGTGKDAQDLFANLKLDPNELQGKSVAEQFYRVHEALTALDDKSLQSRMLLKAVGEDTGKNMLSTLSMSTDQVRQMAAGYALTAKELGAAKEASKAYTAAVAGIDAVWNQVAVSVAPIVAQLAEQVSAGGRAVARFIAENRAVVVAVAAVGAGLVAAGAAFVALGGAAMIASAYLGVLKAAFTALGTIIAAVKAVLYADFIVPAAIIGGAVAAVAGGLIYLWATSDSGREALQALGEAFRALWGRLTEAWAGISAAVESGDLAGALGIVWATIQAEAFRAFVWMERQWHDAQDYFINTWADVRDAVVDITFDLAADMAKALLDGIDAVMDLVTNFGTHMTDALGAIAEAVASTVKGVFAGLMGHLKGVLAQMAGHARLAAEIAVNPVGFALNRAARVAAVGQEVGAEVQQALDAANQETAAEQERAKTALANVFGGHESREAVKRNIDAIRAAQRERLDAERAGRLEDQAAAARARAENRAADQAEFDADAARRIAAAKAKAAARLPPAPEPGKPPPLAAAAAAGLAEAIRGTSISSAISGILSVGDKVSDRIAQATEKTADGVKAAVAVLEDIQRDGGAVFA